MLKVKFLYKVKKDKIIFILYALNENVGKKVLRGVIRRSAISCNGRADTVICVKVRLAPKLIPCVLRILRVILSLGTL